MAGRPTRPALRERYDRRRQEVIYEAAKAFARHGYDTTTMQELAATMGLATGALYHYFGGKEQLLMAICDQLMDPLLEPAHRAARRAGVPPRTSCGRSCGCGWPTSSRIATTCSSSSRSAT